MTRVNRKTLFSKSGGGGFLLRAKAYFLRVLKKHKKSFLENWVLTALSLPVGRNLVFLTKKTQQKRTGTMAPAPKPGTK